MLFYPIRPATAWALLIMEAALAFVPASLLGNPWMVVLLPLGYAVPPRPRWAERRKLMTSYRWLGLALSIALWGISNFGSLAAGQFGLGRLLLWGLTGVVPVLLGLALWWHGGVLARSEVGAREVRTEFVVLGGVALAVVVLLRGLANPPTTLVAGAGLVFVASGLLALGLARQDAADAYPTGGTRALAGLAAAAPTGAGLLLAGVLTPALVAAIWAAFGTLLQILFAPLLALLQWLASLLPRLGPAAGLPPRLTQPPLPDLSQLPRQAGPPVWLVWVVLGLFLAMTLGLVIVMVKLLLAWSAARRPPELRPESDVQTEAAGSPKSDARALLGWLLAWLRARLFGAQSGRLAQPAVGKSENDDARAAYRSLLAWARAEGLPRRAAETTQQFLDRLIRHAPEASATFDLVTEVYEWDRYGEKPPTRERLVAVRRHLEQLFFRRPS
jgi:Domain of unknown function (DUF4129)